MNLPALLPGSLQHLSQVRSDQELFEALIEDLPSLVLFFEYALDDETWSRSHLDFLQRTIDWMTSRSFDDTLLFDAAKRVAAKIREHHGILDPILPKNLTFIVNNSKYPVNGLLWGSLNRFWRERIRRECRDFRSKILILPLSSLFAFEQILKYVSLGKAEELWKYNEQEIQEVLELANEWQLFDLSEICQALLEKYITDENAIQSLLKIDSKRWPLLKQYCIHRINDQGLGFKFDEEDLDRLALEFLNFSDTALTAFEAVRQRVSRLIFSGDLTDYPKFSEIVNRCPRLVGIDVGATAAFTERLLDIPGSLEELDLSRCDWLSNATFKRFMPKISNITKIRLSGNKQLNYTFWGLLKELSNLQKLDLSSNTQISDDDLRLILQACRGVTYLSLNGCSLLSDHGFLELRKMLPKLMELDIGRTNISDSGLLDIVLHCPFLRILKVSRCPYLTDKGVLEVLNRGTSLEVFDCSKCHISAETFGAVHQSMLLRPGYRV